MNKAVKLLRDVIIIGLIVLVLLEVGLRLWPALIPPEALRHFNPIVRSEIAERLNLQSKTDIVDIPRDDNGPPLWINKGGATLDTKSPDDFGFIETVTMDAQGFCNPEQDRYDPEHIDVLALGDSLTWCTGVHPEDTWISTLGERSGESVYNLASPGKGLYEYLQILKTFGLEKTPHTVIMGVFEGNDVRDAYYYKIFRTIEETGEVTEILTPCPFLSEGVCGIYRSLKDGFIGSNSYAFNLIVQQARRYTFRYLRNSGVDTAVPRPVFTYTVQTQDGDRVFNRGDFGDDEVRHALLVENGDITMDIFRDALDNFVLLSKEHSFTPILIYIPSAQIAYKNFVTFEAKTLKETFAVYSDTQRSFFEEHARDNNYRFVDATEIFQSAAEEYLTEETAFAAGVSAG